MDVLAARSSPPGFIFGGHDPYSTVVRVEVAARGTCADFAIECNVAWEPWQELLSKPSWDETVDWCLGIPPTIRESTPCE
jgi:hypothetical protein